MTAGAIQLSDRPSREEIEVFLQETSFTGYQKVPLPFGLYVPGDDHAQRAADMLGEDLTGETILDIGTYYGMFPAESARRGAARAVGLEADPERYEIARQIARLNGDRYEIVPGKLEDMALTEKFDIVLFLNVLHHVLDPIEAVLTVARYCRKRLIVEFCLPTDPAYLYYCRYGPNAKRKRAKRRIVNFHSALLRFVAGNLPIMAVGNREYHRTFYISRAAFHNMFVVHHKLFSRVDFLQSRMGKHRTVAVCEMA